MRQRSATPNQVLGIVCVGIVLANLDLFIVNVAFPNIGRSFPGSTLEDLSWVLNGYAVAYAALLVFFGRLAERYHRNHSFLVGVGLFTAASAACAASGSVWVLVAFRVLQAAGAALMTPTSLGLLLASFSPERRAGAVRTWTAIGGLGAALGPMVGGLLVTVDWRWIFIVNVPFGLVAMLLGWRLLPDVPGHDVPRPSTYAAALVTGGIGLVVFAVIKVGDWGWRSQEFAACAVASALVLMLFVRHCMRAANPFVDPSLFRIRSFAGSILVAAPFSAAFGGMLLSIALFEQAAWRYSALQTGLTIAPGPVMVPLTSLLLAGRLIKRFGPAPVISAGLILYAAGLACWALLLGPAPNPSAAIAGIVLTGIGVGLTTPTLMGAALGAVPPSSFATAAGVVNMVRQAFMAIGVAILIAVLGSPQAGTGAIGVFHTGWWLLALMSVAGLVPTVAYLRNATATRAAVTVAAD